MNTEKLQNILDNHFKGFGESLHYSMDKQTVWKSKIRALGCCFHSQILGIGDKVPYENKIWSNSFKIKNPTDKDCTILVPNDIALKILGLGYLP